MNIGQQIPVHKIFEGFWAPIRPLELTALKLAGWPPERRCDRILRFSEGLEAIFVGWSSGSGGWNVSLQRCWDDLRSRERELSTAFQWFWWWWEGQIQFFVSVSAVMGWSSDRGESVAVMVEKFLLSEYPLAETQFSWDKVTLFQTTWEADYWHPGRIPIKYWRKILSTLS